MPAPHSADLSPTHRLLMVAFHFPPLAGSSGIQRTLRFVQHLPAFNWQPLVLSAHPRAYADTSGDLLRQVPAGAVVRRAFALDSARHLAIAGRYPGWLGRPDRWRSWAWGAVPAGMEMIRRYRPDAIWSTYPIASAHAIALRLQKLSGLPLIADFRDPMAQPGYPADPKTWRAFDRIEREVVHTADRVVFVTPGACAMYRTRYPQVQAQNWAVIENGFDEESFVQAGASGGLDEPLNPGCITLLHSGIVYPAERDPSALFAALGRLLAEGRIKAGELRIRFRASVHEGLLHDFAARTLTSSLIEVLPALPYIDALREMMQADGLLLMQGANCNEQIPAKLYEYLRAGRPILGLAHPDGDTGRSLDAAGVEHIAALEDGREIEQRLLDFIRGLRSSPGCGMPPQVDQMSRRGRAEALAKLLDDVLASRR